MKRRTVPLAQEELELLRIDPSVLLRPLLSSESKLTKRDTMIEEAIDGLLLNNLPQIILP